MVYKNRIRGKISSCFLAVLFILNSVLIIERWIESGRPPLSNTYETMLFFSWGLALFYFLFQSFSYPIRKLQPFFILLILIVLISAASIFDKSVFPLIPALQSRWLTVHVMCCILGYTLFACSFIVALSYLVRRNEAWEILTYRFIVLGLFFLSAGIVTGSIWGQSAWGRWWGWDPKESWALITWLIYMTYIHTRILGWRGVKTSWIAVVGFTVVIFTYLGVNFLLKGLHSYG